MSAVHVNTMCCVFYFWLGCYPVFTLEWSRVVIRFYFERAQTCVPEKLDLSLCTVGTSSAFLQTADNICFLTCTVTCRTLLTHPPACPPALLIRPAPSSSLKLRSTNPVPSPQAASSQCKLKLHFILSRLD